ncbi:YbcC family protein [Rhodoferax sp.]|jgi:uncharacterized protein YbcC (UPF0753/DUF2309 family)|uniref:YbcC family protein n=1 Tax=Rhodoferax sp. TaxID=50421 RepID=UPI0037848429
MKHAHTDRAPAERLRSILPKQADAPDMTQQINTACEQACQAIAPAWPLDRAIAVNPHWSRIGMPVRQVAARMAVLAGIRVFPSRADQRQAWSQGRITPHDLQTALTTLAQFDADANTGTGAMADQATPEPPRGPRWTPAQCVEALGFEAPVVQLPLLIDLLDNAAQAHTRLPWRQAITHQVSQTCAAYFDTQQADWQPQRAQGLYQFWLDTLQHDHGIGTLMGLPQLGVALQALPRTPQDAERWVLQRLGLPPQVWADYLEAVLLTVNGWASWCAYLGWQARLEGKSDSHLRELLAIRLAWGAVLLECRGGSSPAPAFGMLQDQWSRAHEVFAQAQEALRLDEVWQVALEAGYQRSLADKLLRVPVAAASFGTVEPSAAAAQAQASALQVQVAEVSVQAAFCIDVRSEPLRRALEAACPSMQTVGFAGFFGLPVAYTPLATAARRPQLPGLLAPALEVTDRIVLAEGAQGEAPSLPAAEQARLDRFRLAGQGQAASRWPGAAFSFVEAAGMAYGAKLLQWLWPGQGQRAQDDLAGLPARYRSVCRPQLAGLDTAAKVHLAAGVLHAMGLERGLAPLVLLVGHGSQSSNNAHAAALDCGACCGQTGEVNARSLALLLNEPAVRDGLHERNIAIPAATWFVAALHNTTTDEIEGFDLDLLPSPARARWDALRGAFAQAGDQVRRERAGTLGIAPGLGEDALLRVLRQRANDGAQTRPEWGLAGNASLLMAPRARSRGLVLEGRSFLHDYDASQDTDGRVLELLMTAPMVVAHWINWQYHASTVDPLHLGSGNKVLHNVVGGHIGVFEGNGGDLRIGLSRQSLHDGQRWVHEPLRLTVVIEAPQAAIEAVIEKHAVVRQLLDNQWLTLWRMEADSLYVYRSGQWYLIQRGSSITLGF